MSTSSPNFANDLPADDRSATLPVWKQELNDRLAASRIRRSQKRNEQAPLPGLEQFAAKTDSRASRLAAKVAERYAGVPSYSQLLRTASAVPAEEPLDLVEDDEDDPPRIEIAEEVREPGLKAEAITTATITISDPMEEALVSAVQPLPVNLIEFPRELIAARKARPRLAEGPLRETPEEAAHDQSQLRIFEVAPENISSVVKVASSAAEWSSIRLDSKPLPERAASALDLSLKAAPLEDRLMAGIFDIALVLAAFALFVLVFFACTAHPPSGKPALLGACFTLGGLFLLYQYLFFRFAEGTPGMRYAKIALCTFEDENPSREAMRRRILLLLLAAAPLGLGLAWAWFDADRLGWHDRMTRMYQRSYSQ